MPEPLPETGLDPRPGWGGKRAFVLAFGVCVAIPVLTVLAIMLAPGRAENAALFIGAAAALLADAAFLLIGIVLLFTTRRDQGLGMVLGMLAGVIIGFGACLGAIEVLGR